MKLNIAVLFGHTSCEHDISIITACQAMRNLNEDKYNIIPVYITKENKYITGENLKTISNYKENIKGQEVVFLPNSNFLYKKSFNKLKKYLRIDVALFCFHGKNGEDGAMQGLFELNNIPYTSTGVIGSVCGANKIVFKEILKGIEVPTVKSMWLKDNNYYLDKEKVINNIINDFKLPVIVKPNTLGSSIGISVANNEIELTKALDLAFELDDRVLIEKFIEDFREVNVASFYNGYEYVYSDIEEAVKKDKFLTFENKYIGGSKSKGNSSNVNNSSATYLGGNLKANLTSDIENKIKLYTKQVFELLNLQGIVRFDYIFTNNEIYLNEINTIPGSLANYLFKSTYNNYSNLLDELINSAILNNSKKENYLHTFTSSVLNYSGNGNKNGGVKK